MCVELESCNLFHLVALLYLGTYASEGNTTNVKSLDALAMEAIFPSIINLVTCIWVMSLA